MTAIIKFDQVGISAGVAGKSRDDGLPGAKVTITNSGGLACTCVFVDKPVEDTSATLVEESPTVWSFTPQAGVYNDYLVEMLEISSNTKDVKSFGIPMPNSGLIIPSHQARGSRTVNLASSSGDKNAAALAATHNVELFGRSYMAWWPRQRALFLKVEELSGSISGSVGGTAFKEVLWRPGYAGTNPLIRATFDAALAEALAAPGLSFIVMDASLSSTFTMPNVASNGASRVFIEAPRVQTGAFTITYGSNDECIDFLGLIVRPGVSVTLSAGAAGPNGCFFKYENEKVNFVLRGDINSTGAGSRAVLKDYSAASASVYRQLMIQDRAASLAAGAISMAGNTHILVSGPRSINSAGAAILAATGTPNLELQFTEGAGLPTSAYAGWSGSVAVFTFPSAEYIASAQSGTDWPEGAPTTAKQALERLAARDFALASHSAALTFNRNKLVMVASGSGAVEFSVAGSGHSTAPCTDVMVWIKANSGITELSAHAAFGQQGNPFINFDPTKGYQAFFSRFNFGGTDITYAITGKVVNS